MQRDALPIFFECIATKEQEPFGNSCCGGGQLKRAERCLQPPPPPAPWDALGWQSLLPSYPVHPTQHHHPQPSPWTGWGQVPAGPGQGSGIPKGAFARGQRPDLPEPPIPSPAPASPWAGLVPLVPVVFPFCFPGSLQWLSNDRNTDY